MRTHFNFIKHTFNSLPEKLKFIIVGVFNSGVFFLVFTALYLLLNSLIHYLFILIIAHFIGVTNSFHTIRYLVFNHQGQNKLQEFMHYNLMYFFLLLLNSILMTIFIEYFELNAILAQAGIIMTLPIFSYYWQKLFLFR